MAGSSSTYGRPPNSRTSFLAGDELHDDAALAVAQGQAAFADGGAHAGGRVECNDAGAARANALGQGALRTQLDLELAREVLALELFVLADVAR